MQIKIEENSEKPTSRILCIDGGGILGTFPAAFRDELDRHLELIFYQPANAFMPVCQFEED
ncbi:MAG: hypothetical protein OXI53_12395 [Nitrospira sp.]|nr:hypothetical protein [Nitrospira sp.]